MDPMTPAEQIVYLLGNKITSAYLILDQLERSAESLDVSIAVLLVKRELQILTTGAKEIAKLASDEELSMTNTTPEIKLTAGVGK